MFQDYLLNTSLKEVLSVTNFIVCQIQIAISMKMKLLTYAKSGSKPVSSMLSLSRLVLDYNQRQFKLRPYGLRSGISRTKAHKSLN